MIRELRRKLITLMMVSFTLIIVLLVAVIVVVPETQKKNEIRRSLESLSSGTEQEKNAEASRPEPRPDGTAPGEKPDMQSDTPPEKPETSIESREVPPEKPAGAERSVDEPDMKEKMLRDYGGNIITIETDTDGNVTSWTSTRDDYYSDEEVEAILSVIRKNGGEFDYADGYYFLRHKTPDGYSYAVLDSSSSANDFERTLTWGIIGGAAAWVVLFLLSLRLTSLMVKPVDEAFRRQTQFISDASHELKTPVAVIQANADVLKNECGESRWLDYIIKETHRMDKLVRELLYLTNLERREHVFSSLDFSRLTSGAVLPFEALAFERGRVLESDIKDDIHIKGDADELEKLVSILLSNALKYSFDGARITVTLKEKHKTAFLSVRNEGEGIRDEDRDRIFERFYRVDKARTGESGSYGLGLAMARTIANNHRAKLTAGGVYGEWVEFTFEIKEE